MELLNKTELTTDLQVNFSKKLFWNSSKKTIFTIEGVLLAIIAIVLSLYIENWWIAALCGALMIIFPIALNMMLHSATKKTLESAAVAEESLNAKMDYRFNDKTMAVKIYVGDLSNQFSYDYDRFVQIIETKDLFVFMIEGNQAFYVEKKGFYDGNIEELSSLLSSLPQYKKI